MSERQPSRLDRLFPRLLASEHWPAASDAWDPEWQPRGRWWMRAQRHGRDLFARKADVWRRLARPGRAV